MSKPVGGVVDVAPDRQPKKQQDALSSGAVVALSIVAIIAIAAICGGVLLITETVHVPDSETCTTTDHHNWGWGKHA